MGLLSPKLRSTRVVRGSGLGFWCPGCVEFHVVSVGDGGIWKFDGNLLAPTIRDSVLVTSGHFVQGWKGPECWCTFKANGGDAPFSCKRCHSFVERGTIRFLNDSTHALRGMTVALPDIPAEYHD